MDQNNPTPETQPNQNPEVIPAVPATPETQTQPETVTDQGQTPPSAEQVPPPRPEQAPVLPPQLSPLPAAPDKPRPVPGQNPALADDVDVIEKEWVDRAEQVVKETQGDPHREEEAVEDLQADYLKKRYGMDIKNPEHDGDTSSPADQPDKQ